LLKAGEAANALPVCPPSRTVSGAAGERCDLPGGGKSPEGIRHDDA
jgi:hypothetical protein